MTLLRVAGLGNGGKVRRVVGVVAGTALVLALSSAVGLAAGLPQGIERFDLGAQLMLRLFGETSDAGASFAAAHGDRSSESPLRELALQIQPADVKRSLAAGGRCGLCKGSVDFARSGG